MKIPAAVALISGTMFLAVAGGAAQANGGSHRHGGARVSIGVSFGIPYRPVYPVVYPGYVHRPVHYRPVYYYYPTVYRPLVVSPSTVYIEQPRYEAPPAPQSMVPPAGSAPQAQQYWYYCNDSRAYYPWVQQCASPWQRVIPGAG